MLKNKVIAISIILMLFSFGGLLADIYYTNITNTCTVNYTIVRVADNVLIEQGSYTAYSNSTNPRTFNPVAPYSYKVTVDATRDVGSIQYSDSDSGYLGLNHPNSLNLYLDVSGLGDDDPEEQD